MAEVAICSLVRDGMEYLPSYRRQLESLRLDAGDRWRLYVLEGDSVDGSHEFLTRWAGEDSRVTVAREHVGDATEREDRAVRWARAANACLDLVPPDGGHTHVLWLEADLCFPPELVRRLLARDVDVIAPMIWLGGLFYDTWGFRDIEGRRWKNHPPYHPSYRPMSLIEMGSVGSCVLFRREVLDAGIRMRGTYEDGLLVGMCRDARAAGFRVFADTSTAILHPVDHWEGQMWRPESVRILDRSGRECSLDVQEGASLGLDPILPVLDGDTMRRAHRRFWTHLFTRLRTNRIDVRVRARSRPAKTYDLFVRAMPPAGPAALPPLRRILLRRARAELNQADPERGPERWLGSLSPRLFRCDIEITMEEAT